MVVQVFPNYEALSQGAAQFVTEAIHAKPNLVLGLAAGNTPLGTYRELVRLHQDGAVDFSRVVFFSLDEYIGLDASDPRSFTSFLRQNLLDHIDAVPGNVRLIKPSMDVEESIRDAGGIDLQILGIGRNGHIAFNEPGSRLDSRTRVVQLAEPAPDFAKTAITMGIATILESRQILLLASGASKAEILSQAISGPVSDALPASALQLHANVTLMAEASSAAHLHP
jgi:glucosamine-6-phosphate deaminase